MLTPTSPHLVLLKHTFGRDHCDPPPLPSSMQPGSEAVTDVASNMSMQPAIGLPQDFDHLVRSVGEW